MTIFGAIKLKYRRWLSKELLDLEKKGPLTEERAICHFRDIVTNLSVKCINYSWKQTKLRYFQNAQTSDPELDSEFILDELNSRLEERLISLSLDD